MPTLDWIGKDKVVNHHLARTKALCEAQHIRPNELAKRAGVTPSSVYSFLDESRREVEYTGTREHQNRPN